MNSTGINMGRLLAFHELSKVKGIRFGRPHLWRLEKLGKFPRRVRLGDNAIAWDEDEIDAYIKSKKAAREAPPSAPVPFRRVRRG